MIPITTYRVSFEATYPGFPIPEAAQLMIAQEIRRRGLLDDLWLIPLASIKFELLESRIADY